MINWKQVDWNKLFWHLLSMLFLIVCAGQPHTPKQALGLLEAWLWSAGMWTGGFIQKGNKDPDGKSDDDGAGSG